MKLHLVVGQFIELEPAAQSWLTAFSAAPDGPRAPASLLALSRTMVTLGAPADACPYLSELTRRFPAAPEAVEAGGILAEAGCPDAAEGASARLPSGTAGPRPGTASDSTASAAPPSSSPVRNPAKAPRRPERPASRAEAMSLILRG